MPTNLASLTNSLYSDAYLSHPTNDWHVLDLFTTGLSDNATRGQLSINQTNLASWSAVLSGVVVLTNTPWGAYRDGNGNPMAQPLTVLPAGVYDPATPATWPPLVRIVNGLNNMRTNFPHKAFQTLGDILATPELTVASPFLNTNAHPTDLGLCAQRRGR